MAQAPVTDFKRFQAAAFVVVGLIFLQMLLGATVRATGSGMGCPDWPLCHGQWLPALNMESILEYSHRAVAALVTVSLLALSAWVALSRTLREKLGPAAFGSGVLLVVLVTFGAITVAYDMPPAVVACHLELAALLLVTWLAMALRARQAAAASPVPAPAAGAYRLVAVIALAAAFGQLFLGAMVSVSHAGLACPDFPACYGMALPPLVGNVGIQMIHRFGAYTVALVITVLVALAEWRAQPAVRRWTRLAALLVVAQIALGVSTVLLAIPPALSVAHLGTGVSLFVTLFLVVFQSHPRLWAKPVGPFAAQEAMPMSTTALPLPRLSLREALGAYYQLTKPAIVMLVVLTGLPAILIASVGPVDLPRALAALIGTSLAAASAAVFNQYFERERDKVMVRTAARPIPSGKVKPAAALTFAIALGVSSMVLLLAMTTWLAAGLALASLLFYGFFYTLVLKDASPQNIVIGGAAGASAPLICWAAVTGTLALPAWIMFMIIFLWTPPHFWALAIFRLDDYKAANLPMYPVVYGVPATARWIVIYSLMLVPLTLLLVPLHAAGPIYFIAASMLGFGFLWLAGAVLRTESKKDATKLFAYSIVYTLALFSALTVDAALGGAGGGAVLLEAMR